MYLMGLDVGTTAIKAAIFDGNGNLLSRASLRVGVITEGLKAEQDPDYSFECLIKLMKECLEEASVNTIDAISISVQGDAMIPVDSKGNKLHNAILGMDYRSFNEVNEFTKRYGREEIYKITGMPSHPINFFSKILWFLKNEKEKTRKVFKYLTYEDYFLKKMGADDYFIDYSMASRSMAFNVNKMSWEEKFLNDFNVNKDKLSYSVKSGYLVGQLKDELKKYLGIKNRVSLVSGGHDQVCAALGAGVIEEGIGLNSHGTADVFSISLDKPFLEKAMLNFNYPCYCHAVENKFFTFALNHTGGIIYQWFADKFLKSRGQSIDDIYKYIEENLPQGSSQLLFLPYFSGSGTPDCDETDTAILYGVNFDTDRFKIAKAILESLGYELKRNIDCLKSLGFKINKIRMVGGGAKSRPVVKLKADILNAPISLLKISDSALLGAAFLAGYSIGWYKDFSKIKEMVQEKEVIYPGEEENKEYQMYYQTYQKLISSLKDVNKIYKREVVHE